MEAMLEAGLTFAQTHQHCASNTGLDVCYNHGIDTSFYFDI